MDSDGWARKTAGPQAVPTSIGSPVLKTSSTPAPTVCVPSVIPPPFLNRPTVVANVVGICRMDARRGEHFSEFVPGSRCAAEYSETTIPPPPPWSTQATSMFRWIPLRTQPALMTQPVRPSLGAPRNFTNCSSPPLLLRLLLLAGSRRTMSPTRYSCQMGTGRGQPQARCVRETI